MRRTLLMALLCTLALCTSAFAGSISGKIVWDDDPPPPKRIKMDADPDCAKKHSGPVYAERLVLGDGNTMANVFVSVKNPPAGDYPSPEAPVVINQKGCVYVPHVVGVRVDQTLQFKNSDGILHNVHGRPKVNREFNIGMPPAVKESDRTFNKPEPAFKVKCDVHPWMNSWVAIMTHPFFVVTGKDGTFKIDNLPDGTYEVEAWHKPPLKPQTQSVKVSGGVATADFAFKKPPRNK